MSGRALRRLREERDASLRQKENEEQEEDDSESDEDDQTTLITTLGNTARTFVPKNAGFTFVGGDLDDSESDSDYSDNEQENGDEKDVENDDDDEKLNQNKGGDEKDNENDESNQDRKSTRLNSSHPSISRMPSSA